MVRKLSECGRESDESRVSRLYKRLELESGLRE